MRRASARDAGRRFLGSWAVVLGTSAIRLLARTPVWGRGPRLSALRPWGMRTHSTHPCASCVRISFCARRDCESLGRLAAARVFARNVSTLCLRRCARVGLRRVHACGRCRGQGLAIRAGRGGMRASFWIFGEVTSGAGGRHSSPLREKCVLSASLPERKDASRTQSKFISSTVITHCAVPPHRSLRRRWGTAHNDRRRKDAPFRARNVPKDAS